MIDSELKWSDEIVDFFEKLVKEQIKDVVIIANDVEGDALNTLAITNKGRFTSSDNGWPLIVIKAPFVGPDREDFMEDIAVYTGGKVISEKNGFKLKDVDPNEVKGTCEKIVVNSKATTIIGGAGKEDAQSKRVKSIEIM